MNQQNDRNAMESVTGSIARQLAVATADDLQAIARYLGFEKTLKVVGELLYSSLPEEAVVVAVDSLHAEHNRLKMAEQEWAASQPGSASAQP